MGDSVGVTTKSVRGILGIFEGSAYKEKGKKEKKREEKKEKKIECRRWGFLISMMGGFVDPGRQSGGEGSVGEHLASEGGIVSCGATTPATGLGIGIIDACTGNTWRSSLFQILFLFPLECCFPWFIGVSYTPLCVIASFCLFLGSFKSYCEKAKVLAMVQFWSFHSWEIKALMATWF